MEAVPTNGPAAALASFADVAVRVPIVEASPRKEIAFEFWGVENNSHKRAEDAPAALVDNVEEIVD